MRNGSKNISAKNDRTRPLLVTTSWDDGHPSDLRLADLMEKHGCTERFTFHAAIRKASP